MSASRWARITAIFSQALEQPLSSRAAWLRAACDDETMTAEVETLLEAYDTDPGFLEAPVPVASLDDTASDATAGQRLGAYVLERQIGRGGMGVVYEARRLHDGVEQRVAIKVLPAWSAAPLIERFRFERRVLAGLDHPGIARLVDTGTTDDGRPYFVMELVRGQAIDVWCREQRLTPRQRVALVERACAAVAHAHQHLVVHRDLKPGNILVTTDGMPKLLDFGIATLLSADHGISLERTATGHQTFTLEFASPEQVRGEPVSTASDVYSLGVLLYLLLTDRKPYTLSGLAPLDAIHIVCDVDPAPASTVSAPDVQSTLRGDLDIIVAKAMRKAPRDRYATVVDLATDLRAWAEGRPVSAAPPVWTYRLRRFVGRHAAAVAAATILALAIVGGGVATAWQAGIASQERGKAQRRFDELQQFSRSMLFEVHESLRTLPGATEPRRLLLARATQLMDGLAADADGNLALQAELAEGYRRLGHVQGGVDSQNVGDRTGAQVSFEKAVGLADAVLARRPGDLTALILSLNAHADLQSAALRLGLTEQAAAAGARHRERLHTLEGLHTDDVRAVEAIANGYASVGTIGPDGLATAERALDTALRLLHSVPAGQRTPTADGVEATALKRLGAVLQQQGRLAESEDRYRQALALDERAIQATPGDPAVEYEITSTLSNLGSVIFRSGRVDDGQALWRRALDIRRAAVDADPGNVRAVDGVAVLLGRFSTTAYENKRYAESVTYNREKVRLREALVSREGRSARTLSDQALARLELAMALVAQADVARAAGTRASLHDEARRLVDAAPATDYTSPTAISGVSVDGFGAARSTLLDRLARH